MEHPFFPTTTTRAEALRWLTIAEKLLSARDLMGSKSFATRARDSDPTLTPADQILVVVDTLLAGDRRIGNNQLDFYSILRLTPQQGREAELVANHYRNLALLLNPQRNKFPFAEEAFRLTVDAWTVLSNPARKSMYDEELGFYSQTQPQQNEMFVNPSNAMHQNFIFFGGNSSGGVTNPNPPQGSVHFSQIPVHGNSSSGVTNPSPPVHFSQVPIHATSSSGVTNPSPPQGPVHFSQAPVHANPQVDPVGVGSGREAQSFMSFTSGSNLVFGGGSGSKVDQEAVDKQGQESYPIYGGNAEQNISSVGGEKNNHEENENENEDEEDENLEEGLGDEEDAEGIGAHEEKMDAPEDESGLTFWTACPYCYHMYEYPKKYVDYTLRCQNCRKAFEGVVIPSPPPIVEGRGGYFCCWGFFPLGFSREDFEKNKGASSSWTPFTPMFSGPGGPSIQNAAKRGPRMCIDEDDEFFVEPSDSSGSDDDWGKGKEKARSVKRRRASGRTTRGGISTTGRTTTTRSATKAQVDKVKNVSVSVHEENVPPTPNGVETPNKTVTESTKKRTAGNARKQPGRVAKNFGKLDLNVEFSNEAEEAGAHRVHHGNGPNRGEEDSIEGIGFFEGLDEFLSNLPILNVVGEDKVVMAA